MKGNWIRWREYKQWLNELLVSYDQNIFTDNTILPCGIQICIDSRKVKPEDIFVPIKGKRFDGHDFIYDAIKNGAKYFLYEKSYECKLQNNLKTKGIGVTDTLKSLYRIAAGWKQHINPLYTFALTGSTGKTTTKKMLAVILQEKFKDQLVVAQGSMNNEIGVPLSLLQLTMMHKALLLEFGARHVGDIELLTKLSLPNIVACLNVQSVHLEEFGSFENILLTKTEIFRHSPKDAILVVFADDTKIMNEALKTQKKIISFGTTHDADVCLKEQERVDNGRMKIVLKIFNKEYAINLRYYHDAYGINVCAAVAMSVAANIELDSVQEGLSKFEPEKGRFNIISKNYLTIIDDSYNANPQSMKSGLISCLQMYPQYQKILILGDMLELGQISIQAHKDIGEFCYRNLDPHLLICVGVLSKYIIDGAVAAGMSHNQIIHFDTVEALLNDTSVLTMLSNLIYNLNKPTAIFVKGSRQVSLDKFVKYLLALK